jgi:predicted ATPase
MIVSRIKLKNWRNFQEVDVPLRERMFLVGPNASGKSNLLDVFRFLRDIAKSEGGGLQKAVRDRGGISKLRCLFARREPQIEIEVQLADTPDAEPAWRYSIGIRQETRGNRQPYLVHEKVWKNNDLILNRPDEEDKKDIHRGTQTHLEQINTNEHFRDIARFFESVTYLHLVPQLLRYADAFQGKRLEDDPFGQGFLEKIAKAQTGTQKSRLHKIEEALRIAVPQLKQLRFARDEVTGRPHLEALYEHWRPKAGWQREDQFSDGTLRLIALLWSLLEGESLLLLEEPELSLNIGIINQLASLIYQMQRQRKRKRQILVSTHSADLLADSGIDGREILLLTPRKEGTAVAVAGDIKEVRILLEAGLSVADAVLSRTKPRNVEQLGLFP